MDNHQKYIELMSVIRDRFDYIHKLRASKLDSFFISETAAFHGRKIVEGIAFGCLVAIERGVKVLPRDAVGKWNAEEILKSLQKKQIDIFPSPSVIRQPSAEDILQNGPLAAVIEGQPERRITHRELCIIYKDMHKWTHELNPYTHKKRSEFAKKNDNDLWNNLFKIEQLIDRHFISIKGEGYFCVLRDKIDGQTKVVPLSKISDIATKP